MHKILVVEDDSRLNLAVCNYLNRHGYESIGVLNASEAYDSLYHNKFDFIISDIMMPEIDGFEFAETVRQNDQAIPILFMTARDDMPSKSKGYLAGIDDYMVKPINFEELLLHIGALLRRSGITNNTKKAFSRSQIMEEFWDADSDATLRAVDMYIAKLRDKFADRPEFKIVTVYGMGYKAVVQ